MTTMPRGQHGLSLVECLIPLAVAALLLGSALPAFQEVKQRRALEAAAAQLETDLQLARAAAVARNQVLRLDFASDAAGSCYVVHDGSAGDCRCDATGLATCSPGVEVVRSQRLPGGPGTVGLRSNVRSMAFDPTVGTVTPTASLRLSAPVGELRLVVNVMGRVRSCTPDRVLPGLPVC